MFLNTLANYGQWTEFASLFKTDNAATPDIPYDDVIVATNTLRDGSYKIKMTVYETGMQPRIRYFPFKMQNGQIIGDSGISLIQYKKMHGIRRTNMDYVFVHKE